MQELFRTMAETVSAGGNLLVNVGPTQEGKVPPIMQERLLQMGEWLGHNGEGARTAELCLRTDSFAD